MEAVSHRAFPLFKTILLFPPMQFISYSLEEQLRRPYPLSPLKWNCY